MGSDRSIGRVSGQLKKSPALLYRWSADYCWKERVQAWGEFQDQLGQQQAIRQRLENNKATLQIAEIMRQRVMDGFLALESVRKVKGDGDEEKLVLAMKPGDLVRMLESSHKLAKDVLGKTDSDTVTKIELHFGDADPDDDPRPEGM